MVQACVQGKSRFVIFTFFLMHSAYTMRYEPLRSITRRNTKLELANTCSVTHTQRSRTDPNVAAKHKRDGFAQHRLHRPRLRRIISSKKVRKGIQLLTDIPRQHRSRDHLRYRTSACRAQLRLRYHCRRRHPRLHP